MRTAFLLLLLAAALSCNKKDSAPDPVPHEMSAQVSRGGTTLLQINATGSNAGFVPAFGYYAAWCRNGAGAEVLLNFSIPYSPGTYPADAQYSTDLNVATAPVYHSYGGPNGGSVVVSAISPDGVLTGTYAVPCVNAQDTLLLSGAFKGKF